MNRHGIASVLILVAILAVISGCGSSGASKSASGTTSGSSSKSPSGGAIKIGVLGPLSGAYASAGTDIVDAAQLAAKNINSKGGVMGKTIKIISQDDACDAQTGVQAAQKLVTEGVVAVDGGYCSGAALPESSVLHRHNIPFVLDASTNPQLTEQGFHDVFRVIGRDDEQGPFAAKFISSFLHAKTAAIIDDNTTYAKGLAVDTQTPLLKDGVKVVYFNAITPGESDYTSVLTKVKSLNPDVIYFTGYFAEGGILIKEFHQLNMHGTFMAGDANTDPTLLKTAGSAANGTILTNAPLAQFLSTAKGFTQQYTTAYGHGPGPYSVYEYDAVQVTAYAVKQAGAADPAKIDQALSQVKNFHGITGTFSFNAKGDRAHPIYITIIVKNQQFEPYKKLAANGKWVSA